MSSPTIIYIIFRPFNSVHHVSEFRTTSGPRDFHKWGWQRFCEGKVTGTLENNRDWNNRLKRISIWWWSPSRMIRRLHHCRTRENSRISSISRDQWEDSRDLKSSKSVLNYHLRSYDGRRCHMTMVLNSRMIEELECSKRTNNLNAISKQWYFIIYLK